jgi:hypothetical protein
VKQCTLGISDLGIKLSVEKLQNFPRQNTIKWVSGQKIHWNPPQRKREFEAAYKCIKLKEKM